MGLFVLLHTSGSHSTNSIEIIWFWVWQLSDRENPLRGEGRWHPCCAVQTKCIISWPPDLSEPANVISI